MSKNMDPDKINFNYPIPKDLHRRIRTLSLYTGEKVKDIVITALERYMDYRENGGEDDDL